MFENRNGNTIEVSYSDMYKQKELSGRPKRNRKVQWNIQDSSEFSRAIEFLSLIVISGKYGNRRPGSPKTIFTNVKFLSAAAMP